MAKKEGGKKSKDVANIEQEKVVAKKRHATKSYTLKQRHSIGGVWKEKGEKINLTKEGYDFFRSKNIV